MKSTEFLLVSQKRTVVSVEPGQICLQHRSLEKSSLSFRLTLPDAFQETSEALKFEVFGVEFLLHRAGGAWALSRDGAFASAGADAAIDWDNNLGPDNLFNLIPAESALLVSPVGGQVERPTPSSRRRLLIVAPWLVVGGAEKVNLDLATGLGSDIEITLVTTLGGGPWKSRFEAHVERLILLGQLLPPQFHGAALALLIQRLEIDCVLISNSWEGYASLGFLREHFPTLPIFDLLHGQGGKLERGGYPASSMPFDHYLSGRIVITDYLRDLMVGTYGVAQDRITRIHNGVDIEHFSPVEQAPSAMPVVSFIGRLSHEKHPEHVVEIARALANTTPCHFKIAGDGPLKGVLAQMLVGDPPSHQVDLIGHIEDVRETLAQTHVLLLTSEMEGLPIIILEAMAMGIPVVCSAVGGIPELVRHGVDGLLVPYGPNFVEEATDVLRQLLADSDRRLAMGRSARERVAGEFDITTMMQHYRALLAPGGEIPQRRSSYCNPIERSYNGAFFVQKLRVRDVAYRLPYLKQLVTGRRVLHVGCTDFPVFDPRCNLHIQLKDDCAVLDGLDTDREGMNVLSTYVPGRYFTQASDVHETYDLLLVPETIEHVQNIQEFLVDLHKIDFREILITAPCLIGWNSNFAYADRAGRLSPLLATPQDYFEEVHPDHKAWFSPYTLANCIEQFTTWRITEVLFLDAKRMTAVHCCKDGSASAIAA